MKLVVDPEPPEATRLQMEGIVRTSLGQAATEEGVHVHVARHRQAWSVIVSGSREHGVIVSERVRAALEVSGLPPAQA